MNMDMDAVYKTYRGLVEQNTEAWIDEFLDKKDFTSFMVEKQLDLVDSLPDVDNNLKKIIKDSILEGGNRK